ncbi:MULTISPECIES: hypothetical protein [unclassified Sphingobacterium]|uniref:hypothetical protein n=1 Tax=unclassified Sphingobacterium TaxID=2609468 RepID=UPI0025DA20D7|nr:MULTISPECIES: hypothetical protein [unclassified Sphingobacterium]
MLRVELIFFRRCLFLLPIFVFAGTVNGQQLTSLNNWEQNFSIVNRWIDPFFPLNTQHSIVNLEQEAVDKRTKVIQGEQTMDKVDGHAVEISNIVVVHSTHRGDIKYSSSSSSGLYRVALDKQTDERYDGKPVFVDAKGIKYIIDSKYRKQFIK